MFPSSVLNARFKWFYVIWSLYGLALSVQTGKRNKTTKRQAVLNILNFYYYWKYSLFTVRISWLLNYKENDDYFRELNSKRLLLSVNGHKTFLKTVCFGRIFKNSLHTYSSVEYMLMHSCRIYTLENQIIKKKRSCEFLGFLPGEVLSSKSSEAYQYHFQMKVSSKKSFFYFWY